MGREGAGAGMERYIYKEKCKTAFIVPREFLALWCGEKAIQLERMVGKLWQYQRRESSGRGGTATKRSITQRLCHLM